MQFELVDGCLARVQSCIEYNNDVEGDQGQSEFIELAKQLRTQAQEMGAKVRAPAPCLRSLAVPPYVCHFRY